MQFTSSAAHELMHSSTSELRPEVGAAAAEVVSSWALTTAMRPARMTGVKRMLAD